MDRMAAAVDAFTCIRSGPVEPVDPEKPLKGADNMGVARIFQRGDYTVSKRGYSRFRNLNLVGCLRKKGSQRGGGVTGPPWTLPP